MTFSIYGSKDSREIRKTLDLSKLGITEEQHRYATKVQLEDLKMLAQCNDVCMARSAEKKSPYSEECKPSQKSSNEGITPKLWGFILELREGTIAQIDTQIQDAKSGPSEALSVSDVVAGKSNSQSK